MQQITYVGMVTVGIYPTSPAAEVAYLLQAADVGAVVCEDQEQLDKVLEAMPELAAVPIMSTRGRPEA